MAQKQAVCPKCGPVLAVKESPNHALHFFLTFISCGVWFFVWPLIAAKSIATRYRCSQCGMPIS